MGDGVGFREGNLEKYKGTFYIGRLCGPIVITSAVPVAIKIIEFYAGREHGHATCYYTESGLIENKLFLIGEELIS